MSEPERRSIVWDAIERLAFRPTKPKNWLGVYAKTLHKLWGMDSMWTRFACNGQFDVPFLMLNCDYSIESFAKYSVSIIQDLSTVRCFWQNHIDPQYLSKGSLYSAGCRYPHQQIAHLQSDIEAVLDGMIFHPRCHVHLQDLGIELDPDSGGLSSHAIRIGGGIENAYAFLFHLRYQFCLVSSQARDSERTRLINLFENAIRNNGTVNARDLFNFQGGNN